MSIGRNREEQELTSKLAATLVVREVLKPMSKIGWGHGSPPPPESGQPTTEGAPRQTSPSPQATDGGRPDPSAPVQTTDTAQPKTDTPDVASIIALHESMKDPTTGLYQGKYKTLEESLKGSGHLAKMAKQAFSDRDAMQTQVEALNQEINKLRNSPTTTAPVVAPQSSHANASARSRVDAAQEKLDKVLSSITENGGVLDVDSSKALSAAQRELSDAAADFRIQEDRYNREATTSAEDVAWRSVEEQMIKDHPESVNFVDETALHVQSDPLLKSAVNAMLAQGDRLGATKLAWKSYQEFQKSQMTSEERAKAEERESDLSAREQVRKEQLEKARKDAGVVQGSAGGSGVHQGGVRANSREEIDALASAMRREGDAPGSPAAMAWRRAIIPLDPAIFGPQ